jgi:6-phosphogluconolactonase (cycloisomerase 2 family)
MSIDVTWNAACRLLGVLALVFGTATAAAASRGLAFIEFVLDQPGFALSGPRDLAISPDDKFLYVASRGKGVGVLSIDPAGGRVANVQQVLDVDHAELAGCQGIGISADGAHIYATGHDGDGLLVFERDGGSGMLTHVQTLLDGQGGVDGLDGARQVRVSPDGLHVYVVSDGDNAVAVFERNTTTGELTFVEAHFDGMGGVDGLGGGFGIAIAPDGNHVYATGQTDDSVAAFSRNGVTGELTFVEAKFDGMAGVDGLDGAQGLGVSPDDAHVYVASIFDEDVAVFVRDVGTGVLTFAQNADNFQNTTSIAFSSDGLTLWAGTAVNDGVTSFDRNATTGELTFVERHVNLARGVIGCGNVDAVVTTSDDSFLYLACELNDALTTMQVLDVACPAAPVGGCRPTTVSAGSALTMRSGNPTSSGSDRKDLLSWRWKHGAATSLAEFGDPLSETDYALCVYDASADPQPFARGNIPANNTCKGVPCWQLTPKGQLKYKDKEKVPAADAKTTAPDGLLKVLLKPGDEGKALIKTKQKGEGVAGYQTGLESLARTPPIIVQLISSTGECWEAVYSTPKLNTPGLFKAKSD